MNATFPAKTPWAAAAGDIPLHLDYFEGTMYEAVRCGAEEHRTLAALNFMGRKTHYDELLNEIDLCARALKLLGVRPGDSVAIALPNCPQSVALLYAVNRVGGIATMIHPLSAEKEIETFLTTAGSVLVFTLEQLYPRFAHVQDRTDVVTIVTTSVTDAMKVSTKIGYRLTTRGRIGKELARISGSLPWADFRKLAALCPEGYEVPRKADDPAVILFTGGTTGTSKGAVLTNRNFNAMGAQILATHPNLEPGDKMIAVLPLFHGFGLGVCVHSMLVNAACCVLVPRFTARSFARLIARSHASWIAGVPTLFEGMTTLEKADRLDFSSLKGVFSGGDSLPISLKEKFDIFLEEHGASIEICEGYGATETLSACCLNPEGRTRPGSVGIPFPDTYVQIVDPETGAELPAGETGEILLAGPTVMKEYIGNADETALVLHQHDDGLTWLSTGDLGLLDEDGYLYFKGRRKRMIVASGYNIYPNQLESVLDAHKKVRLSCVIGVPDPYRIQRVKAFVVPEDGVEPNEETRAELMSYCKKHVARYAKPSEIEFRDELPKTLIGKVDYRRLEEEEAARAAGPAEDL